MAQIQSLTRKLPYAIDVAIKKKKKIEKLEVQSDGNNHSEESDFVISATKICKCSSEK